MKSLLIVFIMLIMIHGCTYPTSGVRVLDNRPSIAIQNAPNNAILVVDGIDMGLANNYDGRERTLIIEPGTHKIEVLNYGKTLLSEKVFLGQGEMKLFKVFFEAE